MSLRRVDHSSRGDLPSVVGPMSVITRPNKGGHEPETGRSAKGKKSNIILVPTTANKYIQIELF
jgi:hypothetical protein